MNPPPEIRKYRRCLLQLVQNLRRSRMIGVEVGVAMGATSALLLDRFPNLTMVMVDPWTSFDPESDYSKTGDKRSRLTNEEQNNRLVAAKKEVAFAAERAIFYQMSSVEAAHGFDLSVDFVFIDGSHAYHDVADDLNAWWPKLNPRGLFCGHDYSHGNVKFCGVRKAVDEFFNQKNLQLCLNTDCAVWWGYKP